MASVVSKKKEWDLEVGAHTANLIIRREGGEEPTTKEIAEACIKDNWLVFKILSEL